MSASNTPTKATPLTTVAVKFTIEHPLWQGDGEDEAIVVECLRGLLRRHVAFASFEIQDVETDA